MKSRSLEVIRSLRIKVLLVSDLTLKRHNLNNVAWWCVAGGVDFMVEDCRVIAVKFLALTVFVLDFVENNLGVIMTGIAVWVDQASIFR